MSNAAQTRQKLDMRTLPRQQFSISDKVVHYPTTETDGRANGKQGMD